MSLKGKVVQQTCDCEFEEIPELYLKSDVDLAVQQLKHKISKQRDLINQNIDKELTFTQATYYLQGLEFAEMMIEEEFQ